MFTKLFAGSFLALGLLLTGAVAADEKPKDCCSANLACCKEKSACCEAKSSQAHICLDGHRCQQPLF